MKKNKCLDLLMSDLLRLVTTDYVLLDLPYFMNIGDVLIWQSSLDLLKELPYKCLYSASQETYIKPDITKNTLIIFMGGGNFGDLWKSHQLFRQKVLLDFPDNPIIQLPQSILFNDDSFLNDDLQYFNNHNGKITICCRDYKSFDFAQKNYLNCNVELWPDLVLAFDVSSYKITSPTLDNLFVKREDSEKVDCSFSDVPKDSVISDWPLMKQSPFLIRFYRSHLQRYFKYIDRKFNSNFHNNIIDFLYKSVYRKYAIQNGISFICKYKNIYTTRLHSGILAALLGKQVYLYDNSYKKVSGVYNLWMKEFRNVVMMS